MMLLHVLVHASDVALQQVWSLCADEKTPFTGRHPVVHAAFDS